MLCKNGLKQNMGARRVNYHINLLVDPRHKKGQKYYEANPSRKLGSPLFLFLSLIPFINPIQDELFRGSSRIGGGGKKAPL